MSGHGKMLSLLVRLFIKLSNMPYNFELAVSANISAKVVEDMVKKIVEEQTGKKVANVQMKMRIVTKGIGPSESTETIFDGASVTFLPEKPSVTNTIDRSFKPDTYVNP